jgi:hypothetical protein
MVSFIHLKCAPLLNRSFLLTLETTFWSTFQLPPFLASFYHAGFRGGLVPTKGPSSYWLPELEGSDLLSEFLFFYFDSMGDQTLISICCFAIVAQNFIRLCCQIEG